MAEKLLELNLFGACIVRSKGARLFEITGAKHRALLVLLATAPHGVRSRSFLQDVLWGTSCYDTGRQSLRRALSDMRRVMGETFSDLVKTRNSEICLDISKVEFIGEAGGGEFLEGLDLKEVGFNDWLRSARLNPGQFDGLFTTAKPSSAVPTIAILPFQIVSGSRRLNLLGDWIASEICRTLSRSSLMAVVSHYSSRLLARSVIDFQAVKAKLAADYTLTGTVRAIGNELIIDADLIDLKSGCILWTRQFKGTQNDYVDQSCIGIAEISMTIGRTLAESSLRYVRDNPLQEIRNQNMLMGAVELMHRPTLHNFSYARRVLNEAIKRMPRSAQLHAWKGKWHILSVFNKWSDDAHADTQKAIDCTARALDIDPHNAFALTVDGFAHNNLLKRLDIAESRYSLALDYDPNSSFTWLLKGALHAFTDNSDEGLDATQQAVRLSPVDPFSYFYDSLNASAHLSADRMDEALQLANRSLEKNDRHLSTIRAQITALHGLDRIEEACMAASKLQRLEPNCTVNGYLAGHPAGNFKLGKKVAAAMIAAGIPEGENL